MTNSKIGKAYTKRFEPNPEQGHSSYDRFQQERFGNVLKQESRLDDEAEELENKYDILKDFSNND